MEQPIKDYSDDLDESEYNHFSGAIIVIGFIAFCGIMVWLMITGVI